MLSFDRNGYKICNMIKDFDSNKKHFIFILDANSSVQPGAHAFGAGPTNTPNPAILARPPFGPRTGVQPGLLGPPPPGLRPMMPPQAGNGNIRPGFNPAPNAEQPNPNVPSFPPGYGEVGFDEDQIRSFIREQKLNKGLNNRRPEGPNNGGPNQGGPPQQQQPPFRREDSSSLLNPPYLNR